jgi:glycosyltransferase involved in cell wall biosynthesis
MKVLIVHPQFDTIGGAEKVALKIIQLLVSDFDAYVTVLSGSNFDPDKILRESGISISKERVTSEKATIPKFSSGRLFHTKIALLHRKAKKIATKYDLLVSSYNELDFGIPSVQYIHHPMLPSNKVLNDKNLTFSQYGPLLNTLFSTYRKINDIIAQRDIKSIRSNTSVANSIFIADIYKEIYLSECKIVYPSIVDESENIVDTTKKLKQILCISRFSPDKNIDWLLNIFDQIYLSDPTFKFVIAGQTENELFFEEFKKRTQEKNYPIELFANCSRKEIIDLYLKSEYYINPKKFEHFGIAVLEAMKHGSIPFVHSSGGSLELVPFPELQFQNEQDIPQKILNLDSTKHKKQALRKKILSPSKLFNESTFKSEMSTIIELHLKENNSLPNQ